MALTSEKEVQHANSSVAEDGSHAEAEFPTPYLGRSVRIVDKVVNVDMNQSPHPKNSRGELVLQRGFEMWCNAAHQPCVEGGQHDHTDRDHAQDGFGNPRY